MPCPSSCPYYNPAGCPIHADPEECDLLPLFPADKELHYPSAPLHVQFSCRDEWRHIPADEIYPVWTVDDFGLSVQAFRVRHESQGALVAFSTEDLMEWRVWGEVPEMIHTEGL